MSEFPALTTPAPPVHRQPRSLIRQSRGLSTDKLMAGLARTGALSVIGMLIALLIVLTIAAWPSITAYGVKFLYTSEWRPNALEEQVRDAKGHIVYDEYNEPKVIEKPPVFGALAVIYGTAVSSVLALVFAVPLSFGTALFLVRLCPKFLTGSISFLVEFLAAIPSIAYGMWGLFVLAPLLKGGLQLWDWLEIALRSIPGIGWLVLHIPWIFEIRPSLADPTGPDHIFFRGVEPMLQTLLGWIPFVGSWLFINSKTGEPLPLNGADMFCGGLVLAIMILPIITAISRDVLKNVPRAQIEGTLALGATWWQSSFEMLRYSRSALFGAVMLGLGRAAGETMAITMVIGNSNQIHRSLFAPAQTMSSLLANEYAEAGHGVHIAALTEVALILLLMSLIFNVVARWLVVGKNANTAAAH